MNEKLIPFSLEACMRGEEVVTRDGRPYKFGAYSDEVDLPYSILGWIDGKGFVHNKDGCCFTSPAPNDLFMKPKTRKVTIEIYENERGGIDAVVTPYGGYCQRTKRLETIEREYSI